MSTHHLRRWSLIILLAGLIPTLTGFTPSYKHDEPTERDLGAYLNKRYDYKHDVIDTVTAETIIDVTHRRYGLTLPYKASFNKELPELLQMIRKDHKSVQKLINKRLKWNSLSEGKWTFPNGNKDNLTIVSKRFAQDFVVSINREPIYVSGKWKGQGKERYEAFRRGGYSFLAR